MKSPASKDSSAKGAQAEDHTSASLDNFGLADGRPEVGIQKEVVYGAVNSTRSVAQRREFDDALGSDHLHAFSNNRTRMPDRLKQGIEGLSGFDLSEVQVHYNSGEPAKVNARAYAQGNEIHLAPGEEKHLPHEAWHVVQQMQGRVKPTISTNGLPINNDPALEKEATSMGAEALQKTAPRKNHPPVVAPAIHVPAHTPAQLIPITLPDNRRIESSDYTRSQLQKLKTDYTGKDDIIANIDKALDAGEYRPEDMDTSGDQQVNQAPDKEKEPERSQSTKRSGSTKRSRSRSRSRGQHKKTSRSRSRERLRKYSSKKGSREETSSESESSDEERSKTKKKSSKKDRDKRKKEKRKRKKERKKEKQEKEKLKEKGKSQLQANANAGLTPPVFHSSAFGRMEQPKVGSLRNSFSLAPGMPGSSVQAPGQPKKSEKPIQGPQPKPIDPLEVARQKLKLATYLSSATKFPNQVQVKSELVAGTARITKGLHQDNNPHVTVNDFIHVNIQNPYGSPWVVTDISFNKIGK